MSPGLLLLASALLGTAFCDSTFRFGAVLSTEGSTADISGAQKGYELYFDTVNARSDGRGFFVEGKPGSEGFYFKYEFLRREDFSNRRTHKEEVMKLLEDDKIHFLGGSHPEYALDEMRMANESNVLCYHCCVGPDTFYERNFRTAFGITASNADFTRMLMRRLSFENATALTIIYQDDDDFTRETCEAADRYATEITEIRQVNNKFSIAFNGIYGTQENATNFAKYCRKHAVDAVIACVTPDQGKILVNALHEEQYPLKAFYLTVGPTKQLWVDSFNPGEIANDLLSSTQWHAQVKYSDNFFSSTKDYVELFKKKFGEDPDEDAAAASAVGVTLTQAIMNAFASCDISKTEGDVDALLDDPDSIVCDDDLSISGHDRVLNALKALDIETFFGKIKFNFFRRNVGIHPVTTQVFAREAGEKTHRVIEPVLPFGHATELFRFPAVNRYKEDCIPGEFIGPDTFEPCVLCPAGESSHKVNADHCDSCPIGEWTDKAGQSSCNRCPAGTFTNFTGATQLTDCICKVGYFNPDRQRGVECKQCPHGASCAGDTEPPVPHDGYWSDATTTEVYECDPSSVCLGGENSDCHEGYAGRLCAGCDEGHFSLFQRCHKCWRASVIVVVCILVLIAWYVMNVTVSRSVASLEIILSWAQLANIVGDINLHWTPMVTTMFGVANILDFDVDILEPSCLFHWDFTHNFVVQLCLPFVMTLMASSGYVFSAFIYHAIKHKWINLEGHAREIVSLIIEIPDGQQDLNKKWDATIATFLASVDITYVTIAKYCFDCFKCVTIADVSVLEISPDVECGTEEHNRLMLLGSIGIVFYVFGYLALISWKLYDLRNRRSFSDESNIQRFGFVYQKYELDYFFTPAIAIIRKLLFVLVLVYMNNPAFQVGTLAIVINVSLMIHVYTAPYVETYLDVLFSFLLVALMFEAFGGLMFYSENLPSDNRFILEWIVMATLFLLVCVFLVIFIMEMLTKYQLHFLKKRHREYARRELGWSTRGLISSFRLLRGRSSGSSLRSAPSLASSGSSFKADKAISYELLHTFHPWFVYKCLKKRPDLIQDWNRVTNMLKDYMSDQSETSYLSMKPAAKFWRRLVDRFPEVIDLLAVADGQTREQFNELVTNLYRNFYLSKKLTPLPLMRVLNWRDHAPMAQWLAVAPEEDRSLFIRFVSEMFRAAGKEEAAETLESRLQNGGQDPRLWTLSGEKRFSKKQQWIIDCLSQSNPLTPAGSLRIEATGSGSLNAPKYQGLLHRPSLAGVNETPSPRPREESHESLSCQPVVRQSSPDSASSNNSGAVGNSANVVKDQSQGKSDETLGKAVTFSSDLDEILGPAK